MFDPPLTPLPARFLGRSRFSAVEQQDEVTLYGRRVSPTLEEALKLPPPWQDRAEEDETLGQVVVKHIEAVKRIR